MTLGERLWVMCFTRPFVFTEFELHNPRARQRINLVKALQGAGRRTGPLYLVVHLHPTYKAAEPAGTGGRLDVDFR